MTVVNIPFKFSVIAALVYYIECHFIHLGIFNDYYLYWYLAAERYSHGNLDIKKINLPHYGHINIYLSPFFVQKEELHASYRWRGVL